MKLERLAVAGFGGLPQGLELEFGPGLNLINAPNEAGKTTLAELITGLFYGFGRRSAGVHPYEPWGNQTAETGGELEYRLDEGQGFVLARHLLRQGERVRLADASGREIKLSKKTSPGVLHLKVERGVFITVSRLGLDDLQQAFSGTGRELKQTSDQLRSYFFLEAATRGQLASPVGLLDQWSQERESLYSKDKRRGKQGAQLEEEIKAARLALDEAARSQEEALAARHELKDLEQNLASLNQDKAKSQAELSRCQKLAAQAEQESRRARLRTELAGLEENGLADDQALEQAREMEARAKGLEEQAQKSRQQADEAEVRAGALSKGRDPAELLLGLEKLSPLMAQQSAEEKRLAEDEQALALRRQALQQDWGMSAKALAGLEGLPFKLQALAEDLRRARQAQGKAQAEHDALQAPPEANAWRLWAGVAGLLVGAGLLIWGLASQSWWQYIPALALLGAGAWLTLVYKKEAKATGEYEDQRRRQEEALAAAGESVEAVESQQAQALEPLGQAGQGLDPARLSSAVSEAKDLLRQEQLWQGRDEASRRGQAETAAGLAALGIAIKDSPASALEEGLSLAREAANKKQEAQKLGQQAGENQDQARDQRDKLASHLAALGLESLQALELAHQRFDRAREIKAALDELGQSPEGGAPSREEADRLLQQARSGLEELTQQINQLSGRKGELSQTLKHLAEGPSQAQAQAELERLQEELAGQARRHDTLLLAETLLSRAMEEFQLDSQPSLLKRAGEYLAGSTAGAYQWLGSDLFDPSGSGPPQLTAQASPGSATRNAESLSRGARDQLYLSLRLALADEITQEAESLPLILDDPLVNFDPHRLAACLEMIAALSPKRQVLFLTCHPGQADILANTTNAIRLNLSQPV